MGSNRSNTALLIIIKGLVQGVGFRPFVYNLARELEIKGWVKNTNHAVVIHAQGGLSQLELFRKRLHLEKPVASRIESFEESASALADFDDFTILKSTSESSEITSVSPDIAVCDECLADMKQHPQRIQYPLVNCCHCGPRFSIVQELPYDREHTTMASFKMCSLCEKEYHNPVDRRFHAQPLACNTCGPLYSLHIIEAGKNRELKDISSILSQMKKILQSDGIIAFKGTGGFHLVCDALNELAVSKLRTIKHRDTKPFAVLFRDVKRLRKYAQVSPEEEKAMTSFQRPIVILKEKVALAPSVNMGLNTLGAMLPYMPLHHLLFEHIEKECLVMTSGNISDEPVIIDNSLALKEFLEVTDAVLTYNRDIHNRLDDSVIRVMNEKPRLIRRSRGFVPEHLIIQHSTEGILATGAELTGAFAIGKGNSSILSQYCGDLQNVNNFNFYEESYHRFAHLFRFQPACIVHDQHPDYVSSRFAASIKTKKIAIQHHHAHVASVIAEHGLESPVIGVAFDGTGLGTDGKICGSEFLLCSGTQFNRECHFAYAPLPGGDKVVTEPWRTAVAQLYHYFGKQVFEKEIPFFQKIEKKKLNLLLQALEKNINMAYSCSAGRLFDAVAAASEICMFPKFHAEAPMRLEALIDESCDASYAYRIENKTISFDGMWLELIHDLEHSVSQNIIAAKFHNTIVEVIVAVCQLLEKKYHLNDVALSGGTFQNKYLLEKVEKRLQSLNFKVYSNEKVPCNDGGIALGQMYLAAKMNHAK